MSLGVDDYLAWTPADMAQGAVWLRLKANDMEMTAAALRNFAADGTAGQCGAFIEARRMEAEGIADRVNGLSELLGEAATAIKDASDDLVGAVARLRDDCTVIEEGGFERFDDFHVRDRRAEYPDTAERDLREQRAADLQRDLVRHLRDIRECDEELDRVLHGLVDRPVRDRTPEGNGDPFAAGPTAVSGIAAVTSGVAALAEGHWRDAARAAGRGLATVRGLGPAAAAIGFMGAVASRPEDEPLHEAVAAEGIGALAGAAGLPGGAAVGGAFFGPPGAVGGGAIGLAGGAGVTAVTTAGVREWLDHEN